MRRLIFGTLLLIIGAVTFAWAWNTTSTIRESRVWPTAQGTVIASSIGRDSTRIRGGGYNRLHRADIRYSYTAGGRSYESDTFVFGIPQSFADSARAAAVVDAHPVGAPVTVYYDPTRPDRACLEPGDVPEDFGILMTISGAFAAAGAALLIWGAMSRARRSSSPTVA